MSKLAELFQTPQLVSLLSESETQIVLGVQNPQTGAAVQVSIKADMVVLPDEALLFVGVQDEQVEVDLAHWWTKGDIVTDAEVGPLVCVEPEPTWMVTPQGQEVDLRVHAGGLF